MYIQKLLLCFSKEEQHFMLDNIIFINNYIIKFKYMRKNYIHSFIIHISFLIIIRNRIKIRERHLYNVAKYKYRQGEQIIGERQR